jgi:uncharacterized protein YjiS (DUF1127 family)
MVMALYLHGESSAAFAGRRSIPWRQLFNKARDIVPIWLRRQRQRQELRDYLANDHRAVADMGMIENEARDWAALPFWRP